MVFREHVGRRLAIAAVGPDEHRRVRTKHRDLRTQALLGDPAVLVVPLRPFLPLVAAHPAEHERDAELVGFLDDVLSRKLPLQPQHVQAEVLHVPQDRVLAVGVVGEQQIRRVGGAADEEVPAVDGEVEVAALAEVGKLPVGVPVLGDGSDSEPEVGRVGLAAELPELQPQVIEVRLAEGVRPPQVGVVDGQLCELVGGETDFAILPGQ